MSHKSCIRDLCYFTFWITLNCKSRLNTATKHELRCLLHPLVIFECATNYNTVTTVVSLDLRERDVQVHKYSYCSY